MAVTIQHVEPGSPAQRAGLAGGMELVSLDGHAIRDGLDYEFYSPPARLAVVAKDGERTLELMVEKEEYQPLGCVFASYLIDAQHHCKNKCVFCFIDQLPKGMRPSLYFKDDDERLGFLFGNYITLTNMTPQEIDRIIAMRISPVNISVQTANPRLRVEMMANPRAGEVLDYIPRLAKAGIAMNFQLVLCPGINDGEELRRSIEWLASFAPACQSIAAVPVGLSRHREGLASLASYTPESAAAQLDILLEYGDRFAQDGNARLVYPSDEWFLLAGRDIPPEAFYDGYPQLENGVGMWRLFYDDFIQALKEMEVTGQSRGADVATGMLAAPLFRELAKAAQSKAPGAPLVVHPVENRFFGPGVTVSGLLTGQDLIEALRGRLQTGRLLVPDNMLRAEGDLFLDDTSPADLAKALDVEVEVVPVDGWALAEALLEG